ncbi:MAG TPA: hypothetical protein VFY98_10410 [Intrasporangium sp.]|nr:hypothetical protein [Intrasporangium sp.]
MSNDTPMGDREDSVGSHDDDLLDTVAANPELARVAFLLAAQASQRELTGLEGALTTFRAHVSAPHTKRRRPSMIATLAGAKLGATIAGIAVGLGGAATVAYVSANTPATPDTRVTAPATSSQASAAAAGSSRASDRAQNSEQDNGAAVGPDASGHAAQGLCTAWENVGGNGKAMDTVAFQSLVKAAGGEDKVDAFCADRDAPGQSEDRATGKPAAAPTGKPATVPTGKPSDVPTNHKPDSSPTVPDAKPDTVPTASPSHPTRRS